MKKYTLALFFVLGIIFLQPLLAQRVLDKNNFPKSLPKKKFKLRKEPFKWEKESLLDTNAVYVHTRDSIFVITYGKDYKYTRHIKLLFDSTNQETIDEYRKNGIEFNKRIYFFTRFFGNGIAFRSNAYASEPTSEEYNDLEYGTFRYYKFINKDMIAVEDFSERLGFGSTYLRHYYFCSINESGLSYYGGAYRLNGKLWYFKNEKGELEPHIEVKKKVNLYNFKINWK